MTVAPFQLVDTPLEEGITLLEASAGTGKTFAITGIFLRLLLEKKVDDLRQILVVTFTKDATAELRARLREALQRGARVLGGAGTDDDASKLPYLTELAVLYPDGGEVLARALRQFDEISVFTIHGFCRRVLERQAFESGLPFRVEFIENEQDFLTRAAADYWRRHVVPAAPGVAACLRAGNTNPDDLLNGYREFRRLAKPRMVPEPLPVAEALANFAAAIAPARELCGTLVPWVQGETFNKYPPWPRGPLTKRETAARLQRYLDGDDRELGALLHFATAQLRKKKRPASPELALLAATKKAAQAVLHAVEHDFYGVMTQAFRAEKDRHGTMDHGDLLHFVQRNLLDPERGPAFRKAIQQQWRIGLVDEFQDTDPQQWDIFREVFGASGLFMIGDPKQAIYSFRGADVFAYLRARNDAVQRYTLTQNWRSHPELIHTLNRVWGRLRDPFLHRDIGYYPVEPGRNDLPALQAGDGEAPVRLWLHSAQEELSIFERVALECARLIAEGTIGDRAVQPQDLAILVRANSDAELYQRALHDASVPTIIAKAGDVLASNEAFEVDILLRALAEPRRQPLVRAALGTHLLGYTAVDLAEDDDRMWDQATERFDACRTTWATTGSTTALESLLRTCRSRERLLGSEDGYRRLTNLEQLLEMIHERAQLGDDHPDTMAGWYARLRQRGPDDSERTEMRPESDANAARIVTMHRAKGLEYPIVFAPGLGKNPFPLRSQFALHQGEHVLFDATGDKDSDNRQWRKIEDQGEDMRIAYVALTRAVYRVYTVLPLSTSQNSAAAWLWLGSGTEQTRSRDEVIRDHKTVRNEIAQHLLQLNAEDAALAVDGVAVEGAPQAGSAPPRAAQPPRAAPSTPIELALPRTPPSSIPRPWSIASFTSITQGKTAASATASGEGDADSDPGLSAATRSGEGILGFARGSGPGTCLHAILERVDLSAVAHARTRATVESILQIHGFDRPSQHLGCKDPAGAVLAMLDTLARTPWAAPSDADACGTDNTWGHITPAQRLDEWQFHLPLGSLRPRSLARLFTAFGDDRDRAYADHLRRLGHVPVEGFLTGSVDAVVERRGRFFVVDWKSNFLGGALEDYGSDALTTAMHSHHYVLQGHLYFAALRRHLAQRLGLEPRNPALDEHLGGILYVFLRGLDGKGAGVWHHRPTAELSHALDQALDGTLNDTPTDPFSPSKMAEETP